VRVKDEPGSLAALFNLASELNLNIEDVYIDHVVNRPVAVVTLYVDKADLERARKAFQLDGWQLRD
jgi:prephenate dehydrogenase